MTPDPTDTPQAPAGDRPGEIPVAAPLSGPAIHEGELESGASGRVLRGTEITFDTAVVRRRGGQNVVVCGDSTSENRRLAGRIEAAVGLCQRADPHVRHAGPYALPHYQQTRRAPPGPAGHSFYETDRRKARSTK